MNTAINFKAMSPKLGAIVCMLSLLLPACGSKSNSSFLGALGLAGSGDKGGSTLISAASGGVVQLNDEVKLTVPAEALAEDLTISIERESSIPAGEADGLAPFGQAYRFLPKGTGFDLGEPAVLEMYYDAAELARLGLSPQTIQICYYDEELKCYVPVNCFVDIAQHKVTALIEHFTIYLPMAQALLATNNRPYVGLQAPWPTTIRAGAPIYIRATVTDYDGLVAGVKLAYRKLQPAPGAWIEARMTKEVNPQATLHTYGYLIPASFLTTADLGAGNDIEYRIEATDNLGAVQTSATRRYNVTLTYQPGSLNINPATLEIAAGFERFMLARGVDSNNAAFSLIPETFVMESGSAALTNRFAQGILLRAETQTPAGAPDQLTVGFDGESASAAVTIHAGELESIEILDTNGLTIPGDLGISEGTSYAFDVVGHDGYGNTIPVIPVWSADASIGIMDPDGILDTTGCHGPGAVTASLGYFTDTQNVYVQSRAKEITAFSINGVAGEIAYPFITVTLPWGTDVHSLVATFGTTGAGVTVDGDAQESGMTANDFTDPVVYRVTAEDGSTQDYTVRVNIINMPKEITEFSINGVNGTISDTNIRVNMPSGTDVTSMVANFTTTGQVVTVNSIPQESSVTANNFTNPLVYTVTAEDGSSKNYAVKVNAELNLDGLVSHVAGNFGGRGYIDGIGQNARFNGPDHITSDGTNLYITDNINCIIRQIVIATGEVTTIAGLAHAQGTSDGTGSAARFHCPTGITTDGNNLYVTDTVVSTIRKIVISTGEVTTIAGTAGVYGSTDGFGSAALFDRPWGITTDGTNLYVADYINSTIRKIVIATGEVTTFAGVADSNGATNGIGSSARFYYPKGITTDGTNLYVADMANCRIRKIVIETAEVTTLAGGSCSDTPINGTGTAARFFYPEGITTNGTNLYVSEPTKNIVRKIAIATATVTSLAGLAGSSGSTDGIGNTARFFNPVGMATNSTNLYVADRGNNTIRKIATDTSEVTTFAGRTTSPYGAADGLGSAASFWYPYGITSDGTNIYITDTGNCTIRKMVIATGEVATFAGLAGAQGSTDGIGSEARFYWLRGITTDGTNLYVADWANRTIRKIVIATAEVSTLAGNAGVYGSADGTGPAASFTAPHGIATDGINLYITDNDTIRKIVIATREVTTIAGLADNAGSVNGIGNEARFQSPYGITTDGINLYVVERNNHTIRKIVISTAEVTTIAGLAGASGSADGIGSAARFYCPEGISTDGNNLYVVDTNNTTIRKILLGTGEVSTLAGSPDRSGTDDGLGNSASFFSPSDIIATGNRLFITEYGNNCIRKIE